MSQDCNVVCMLCFSSQSFSVNFSDVHGLCQFHTENCRVGESKRCAHCKLGISILKFSRLPKFQCQACLRMATYSSQICHHFLCQFCMKDQNYSCSFCKTLSTQEPDSIVSHSLNSIVSKEANPKSIKPEVIIPEESHPFLPKLDLGVPKEPNLFLSKPSLAVPKEPDLVTSKSTPILPKETDQFDSKLELPATKEADHFLSKPGLAVPKEADPLSSKSGPIAPIDTDPLASKNPEHFVPKTSDLNDLELSDGDRSVLQTLNDKLRKPHKIDASFLQVFLKQLPNLQGKNLFTVTLKPFCSICKERNLTTYLDCGLHGTCGPCSNGKKKGKCYFCKDKSCFSCHRKLVAKQYSCRHGLCSGCLIQIKKNFPDINISQVCPKCQENKMLRNEPIPEFKMALDEECPKCHTRTCVQKKKKMKCTKCSTKFCLFCKKKTKFFGHKCKK